jgi:hypothetical protein
VDFFLGISFLIAKVFCCFCLGGGLSQLLRSITVLTSKERLQTLQIDVLMVSLLPLERLGLVVHVLAQAYES